MIIHCRKMGVLAWVGCGVLAASLTAGTTFAQTDNSDPSSRTRISYGMARDPQAAYQDNNAGGNSADNSDSNWKPARGTPQPPPPQRTYEAPRTGSRNYVGGSNNGADSDASSAKHIDPNTTSRPTPRRISRGDVVRSSYAPNGDSQDGYPSAPTARPRRQPGFVDNITRQITPPENTGSSYGYRPQRARLAMADQNGAPHPANSQPMDSVMHGGEELPPGAQPMHVGNGEMGPPEGEWNDSEGPPAGNCSSCGSCGGCGSCCCRPLCSLFCCGCWDEWMQDFSASAGVQGFKGPVDQGLNGDFGFHEGINWGSPLWDAMGIGAQIGVNVEQSDLSRTNASDLHRNQYFFTAGLFHRPDCAWGWQGGLVFDYLNDSFVDDFTVSQIRGDLSYVFNCHEVGFWFTQGVHDTAFTTVSTTTAAVTTSTTTYTPIDLYAFYYGHRFCNGGEGRIWGGFTGGTGGLVGADFSIPISDKLSIDSGFTYAIPHTVGSNQVPPESWNIAISLVWHPGCRAHEAYCSPYRPLFNVGDNGSFMVDRQLRSTSVPTD